MPLALNLFQARHLNQMLYVFQLGILKAKKDN